MDKDRAREIFNKEIRTFRDVPECIKIGGEESLREIRTLALSYFNYENATEDDVRNLAMNYGTVMLYGFDAGRGLGRKEGTEGLKKKIERILEGD